MKRSELSYELDTTVNNPKQKLNHHINQINQQVDKSIKKN